MHDLFGNAAVLKTENLGIPYMGSKRKYADALICKMLELQPHKKYFYDLFGGGGAMSFAALQKGMTVFYNEKQTDLVDLMRFIFERMKQPRGKFGLFPDEYYRFVTREEFMRLRTESGVYAQFVRICYSFGNNQKTYMFNSELEKTKHLAHDVVVFQCDESLAKFNVENGVAFTMPTQSTRNERRLNFGQQLKSAKKRMDLEQLEQLQRLEQLQQLEQLQRLEPKITFHNLDYRDVKIITPLEETIVYLDPPYRGTTKYIEGIDYAELDAFFAGLPCVAFMSEYNAPFDCIHEIKTRSTLSSTSNTCHKIERLYVNR